MSEMIERVMAAFDAEVSRQSEGTHRPWASKLHDDGTMTIDGVVDVKALARAAIEAMRDPSPAMVEAGMDFDEKSLFGSANWPPTVEDYQTGEWRAMIDAALSR